MKFNAKLLVATAATSMLFACSTPEKADLSSVDPKEAMNEVASIKAELEDSQADLTAHKMYKKGNVDFADAVNGMTNNEEHESILDELSQAKAHYLNAKMKSSKLTEVPSSVLEVRMKSLNAGLKDSTDLSKTLDRVDSSLRSDTDDFTEELSVEDISEYQKKYAKLEVQAVQYAKLNAFKDVIKVAKRNDMDDLAPKTYKKARLDYETAENKISQNPRNESEYSGSVDTANKSAKLLSDVMTKLTGTAKGSSEETALQLVMQERKLGKLSSKLENVEGELNKKSKVLGEVESELKVQKSKTLSAEQQVRFQKAMDQVRKNFSSDEAEVYQQGDKLILRLKKLNFSSGSSTIPTDSIDLLSKVGEIIKGVKAEKVVVQGHTDSRGDAAYNQKLSVDRAQSVAKFMDSKSLKAEIESNGYGESKPLANNEDADGRALNRRVDIVVEVKK